MSEYTKYVKCTQGFSFLCVFHPSHKLTGGGVANQRIFPDGRTLKAPFTHFMAMGAKVAVALLYLPEEFSKSMIRAPTLD